MTAPEVEPLTAEEAVEKALLYTFQLSNKDYRKMQTALSEVAFIRALEQDGFTVSPLDAERAARAPEGGESPRFDHDGTFRHHHHWDTAEPIWWQNADEFGGEKREHRHHHRAARAEPGRELREALQAVWDMGDELDSNHTRFTASKVAERFGVEIEAHNRFSEPPRNRNEEQKAELQAEIDRLRVALQGGSGERERPALEHDREVENALIKRMFDAFKSTDMQNAVPGSVLEHVYNKVYSQLATLADRARKEDAARIPAPEVER